MSASGGKAAGADGKLYLRVFDANEKQIRFKVGVGRVGGAGVRGEGAAGR